jgi:TolB protein
MPVAKLITRLCLFAALICAALVVLAVGVGRVAPSDGLIGYTAAGGIYLLNIDTGLTVRLTALNDVGDAEWSPDGLSIALLRWARERDSFDIYTMGIDGRHLTRLTDDNAPDTALSWSPDANTIAFMSSRDGDGDWDLYTLSLREHGIDQLTDTDHYEGEPVWSPDGRRIAFVSGDEQMSFSNGNIYALDTDGINLNQLTEGNDSSPSWSPDGKYLAFVRVNSDGITSEIFILGLDTNELNQVTQATTWIECIAWAPDGNRIAFLADAGSSNEIYIMNVADMGWRQLTSEAFTNDAGCPVWLP